MKKFLKRGLSLALALIMAAGLLPVTAFAAVDSAGKPKDVNNALVLSFYTGSGFPGEPAVYGTSNYKNINSSFAVRSGATFASSAADQLDWDKISKDIVQGASSGTTSVWGVYDANGTKDYFLPDASIIDRDNEIKMICAVKNCTAEEAENYEIIWYVIKLQHSSGWFGKTEWHIDGVIKEKTKISINYYGNGNTSGNAPLGTASHTAGEAYTVLGNNGMVKKINGVEVAFLGWSAKADGTGEEEGFYQAGDVITPTKSISLYAMWDTTTQYTATVNTYLDKVLTDDSDIHGQTGTLYLSTDEEHYYPLTRSGEGVYTTKITGNGKFHLYRWNTDGSYTRINTNQLTIYNQNGSLDVHHYSVSYDTNGGEFAVAPGGQNFLYGEAVNAVTAVPTREGYRFLGWEDAQGGMIQPGAEVTAAITEAITLKAKWEKTVKVTVNVTVDHNDVNNENGYDKVDTRTDVSLALVSRDGSESPYLETGETLTLSNAANDDKSETVTRYEGYTFADMPGGNMEYTVVASKSGYDTKIEARQDSNGDWIVDVLMTYRPSNFDLHFTVGVDLTSVPKRYIPDAAIVKVTFWAERSQSWEIITQQWADLPGVRVDLDPETGMGSGSYPVWMFESNATTPTPYGYRIVVTSFVYPDGTIVPASEVLEENVQWTDNVYTATVQEVVGGKTYGTLDGAYFSGTAPQQGRAATGGQEGTLHAQITMDLHTVIFDARGGEVNDKDIETVTEQFRIPAFKDYVPTREGGYTFAGWYLDEAYTKPAAEGTDLDADVTLYAKWIEPLTIEGDVHILGKYWLNGEEVSVNAVDKAKEAVVVLQEKRNGSFYDVDSQTVTFTYGDDENGTADYRFDKIPNEGKEYRIQLLVLNYTTQYDNESDNDNDSTAVFGDDNVAQVDVQLTFVPPSYMQELQVKTVNISQGYIPENVLAKITYRDTGDNHPFQVISQHRDSEDLGVSMDLVNGEGSGWESIWKWHTDGTLYEYQMYITKVDGAAYDSDTAPYYITYASPAYWDNDTNTYSGALVATLSPKTYPVIFELNAGADTVTGMEKFAQEEGAYAYSEGHTWSHETVISGAVPQRAGYTFLGWDTEVSDVDADKDSIRISPDVRQKVVLTAQWKKNSYRVTTAADPEDCGSTVGDGTYLYGEQVTVIAVPKEGSSFGGWYEGDTLVSSDAEYIFNVAGNRELTARFTKIPYNVTANATDGGTATGSGVYAHGQTATVTAIPGEGYMFLGWYEDGEAVSGDLSYSFTVTADRTVTAHFAKVYNITLSASPEAGGMVAGGGRYEPNADATITAKANSGYYFVGWYDEEGKLVTASTSFSLTVLKDRSFTAKFEEKVSYSCDFVYIFGYNDKEIGAEGTLLRGELAQMIYRLVKQKQNMPSGDSTFSDTQDQWFRTGISYMVQVGAIEKTGLKANPYVQVSRGETYKMICLGLGFTKDTNLNFSEYEKILRNSGHLTTDAKVTGKIQRWEFCELFNSILGRSGYCQGEDGYMDVSGIEVTAETYGYTDLKPTDHYYRTMMIATSTFTDGKIDIAKREQRNPLDEYGG